MSKCLACGACCVYCDKQFPCNHWHKCKNINPIGCPEWCYVGAQQLKLTDKLEIAKRFNWIYTELQKLADTELPDEDGGVLNIRVKKT